MPVSKTIRVEIEAVANLQEPSKRGLAGRLRECVDSVGNPRSVIVALQEGTAGRSAVALDSLLRLETKPFDVVGKAKQKVSQTLEVQSTGKSLILQVSEQRGQTRALIGEAQVPVKLGPAIVRLRRKEKDRGNVHLRIDDAVAAAANNAEAATTTPQARDVEEAVGPDVEKPEEEQLLLGDDRQSTTIKSTSRSKVKTRQPSLKNVLAYVPAALCVFFIVVLSTVAFLGQLEAPTGIVACEGHDYTVGDCAKVGCCNWYAGMCSSAVDDNVCTHYFDLKNKRERNAMRPAMAVTSGDLCHGMWTVAGEYSLGQAKFFSFKYKREAMIFFQTNKRFASTKIIYNPKCIEVDKSTSTGSLGRLSIGGDRYQALRNSFQDHYVDAPGHVDHGAAKKAAAQEALFGASLGGLDHDDVHEHDLDFVMPKAQVSHPMVEFDTDREARKQFDHGKLPSFKRGQFRSFVDTLSRVNGGEAGK